MIRDSLNSHTKQPVVAIYGVDLDVKNTSSYGIANYTRRLIEALAVCEPPGFRVVLLVSESNAPDFVPSTMPSWMSAHVVHRYGSGVLSRLWADQVLSGYSARKVGAAIIHFPKGYVPVWGVGRQRIVATIHDTIVFYYLRHFPGWFPFLKIRYFCLMTLHALKRADRVLTISEFSYGELIRLYPPASVKTEVIYFGAGVAAAPPGRARERHGLMVLGSLFPHKAIAQALILLNEYAAHKRLTALEVVITGFAQWPQVWGTAPDRLALSFRGHVSNTELTSLYGESRALVLLSEVEGLGLPAIESYEAETPVCYRASTALAELMKGVPGGWDGGNSESFVTALDDALALTPIAISAIRKQLSEKYHWGRAAKRVLDVYGEELNKVVY